MKHDSEQFRAERDRMLMQWIGDPYAVRFILLWGNVTELWDDLIDKDKPVTDDHVNSVMWQMLIELPANPFFLRHREALQAVMASSIHSWHVANEFEVGNEREKTQAYVLRDMVLQMVPFVAGLVHGPEAASRVGIEAWRWLTHCETPQEYVEEHT